MIVPPQDLYFLGLKALIQNNEGKFLMLQVNIRELKKYTGDAYRDIPGGRVDRGEPIEEVLSREILEETGFQDVAIN